MDWLIDEHLLFIDAAPIKSVDKKEHVKISFERLGDHLLASNLIDNKDGSRLRRSFLKGDELHYLCADRSSIEVNKGVLEALSIQIPERYRLELPDLVETSVQDILLEITLSQLHWRNPSFFDNKTVKLVDNGLRSSKSYLVFDELISCSFNPSKVDAYFLDDLLRRRSMIKRDPFWCGYLHSRYDLHKDLVNKILERSLTVLTTPIPLDVRERWCLLLCWFCAAADRRVRDKATKALVNLTQDQPQLCITLVNQFIFIDDDYILERVLSAAYGVLLRSRNKALEEKLAKIMDKDIFSRTEVVFNAVIRDYARSIIQLALHDNTIKKSAIKNPYLPPYKSDSKKHLSVPSDRELESAKKRVEKTKLKTSCFHDDFFNYTLSSLSKYDHFMNKQSMARWVFMYVVNMGYNTHDFVSYEGYMLHNYGGGRGKPVWAERIGKKYQWIALFRLAGLLSDNVKPKDDSWEPKPLVTQLSFDRGRQIDPSILCKEPQTQSFYDDDLYGRYNFASREALSDEEWIKLINDLPVFSEIQQEHAGKNFIFLDGHMEQSNRSEFDEVESKHRRFWILIHSYLVDKKDIRKTWKWLSDKNFMGNWMPEGTVYHEGFVGEYPWGTLFNIYKDSYLSYGRNPENEEFPCLFIPTSSTLHSSEEYDSSSFGKFAIQVPSKVFFKKCDIKWNKIDGYTLNNKLVFVDPSIRSIRKGALLIKKEFLRDFLRANGYNLIWTVLAEKLIMGIDNRCIRQTFNQIHRLNEDMTITSAKPVIEIK